MIPIIGARDVRVQAARPPNTSAAQRSVTLKKCQFALGMRPYQFCNGIMNGLLSQDRTFASRREIPRDVGPGRASARNKFFGASFDRLRVFATIKHARCHASRSLRAKFACQAFDLLVVTGIAVRLPGLKCRSAVPRARTADGITNATIRRDLVALSSVIGVAVDQGWLESNPVLARMAQVQERRAPIVLPRRQDIDCGLPCPWRDPGPHPCPRPTVPAKTSLSAPEGMTSITAAG